MPVRLIDSLNTTDDLALLFDNDSVVAAMLSFEAALARVQARCRVISQDAGDAISAGCDSMKIDPHALASAGRQQATIVIPLVKALTDHVRSTHPEAARFVHWGVTSQDVSDTALVLILRRAHAILEADYQRLFLALARLSEQHAGSVMMGRTLLQAAPPVTFGLKAAGWFAAGKRNWARLDAAFREAEILQFGGSSGTLAALGDRGTEIARMTGEELGLPVPPAPWHSHRDRLAAVVTNCGICAGSIGKIARDVALLMQQEVGEVEEAGAGGSSAMPQKRNPSSCTVALACANKVPGLVADFLAGMVQEQERGAGGLQSEWPSIAGVIEATGAALAAVTNVMEGLIVYPERMRQNIGATHGLIFAEKVMMLIGGVTGREAAHQLLSEVSKAAMQKKISLSDAVRMTPDIAELLTPEQIAELDVPEDYLGAAEIFRRQLLNHQE